MLAQRLRHEQEFHDRQARGRAVTLDRAERLFVADDAYLDHETWIRPAMAKLGDVRGRRLLDFGCGHGMAAVVLARRGARVTAFDLSGCYLAEARARAAANDVHVDFAQANGERLPFADHAFDGVWGNAVLHHLDLRYAGQELRRVLRPGGVAVFCEPWGGNPVLNWARRRLAYPGKERTPEETPLTAADLRVLRESFPNLEAAGHQFLSMIGRVVGRGRVTRAAAWCDERLLRHLRWLRRWCRYVVVTMAKEPRTK